MIAMDEKLLILFAVGVFSGFINILAGGGSLITLPVMIFLGLPGSVANGTNRVAILIQNFAAIAGFRQLNIFPWRAGLLGVGPALVGTYIGATFAVDIPDRVFKPLLAGIMIGVMILIWLDPVHRFGERMKLSPFWKKIIFFAGFFMIGVYGGFIQAGVGFMIITVLLLSGFDLVQTNAIKVFVVFIFTLMAMGIFLYHRQIHFAYGISLGLGSALGGVLATRVAVRKGHTWIRGFVMTMVLVFAIKLVWDSVG